MILIILGVVLEPWPIKVSDFNSNVTGPDGTVAKSSANGLVSTGLTSQYQLQPRAGF